MEAVVRLKPQSEMRLIAVVWQRRGERTSIYGLTETSASEGQGKKLNIYCVMGIEIRGFWSRNSSAV